MFSDIDWQRICQRLVAIVAISLVLATSSAIRFANKAQAQEANGDKLWSDIGPGQVTNIGARSIIPQSYRTLNLNVSGLQEILQTAPLENSTAARNAQVSLSLPLPNGSFGRFRIINSPIMVPELAAQIPEVKTYAGQGIDDPTATVRLDWTPAGFHAMILAASDTVFIDPYSRGDTAHYTSYFKRDYIPPAGKTFREAPLSGPVSSVRKKLPHCAPAPAKRLLVHSFARIACHSRRRRIYTVFWWHCC